MAPKRATDDEKNEFLSHHLPYEVAMLRWTYEKLCQPIADRNEQNATIESFCLHARNLLEFFLNARNCSFDPTWFASSYAPRLIIAGPLFGKLSVQIVHLSSMRSLSDDKKISGADREQMLDALEKELEAYAKRLDEAFASSWSVPAPKVRSVMVSGAASTTSAPTSSHSITGPDSRLHRSGAIGANRRRGQENGEPS